MQIKLLHSTFNEFNQSMLAMGLNVENNVWHNLPSSEIDPESQRTWELHNSGSVCLIPEFAQNSG